MMKEWLVYQHIIFFLLSINFSDLHLHQTNETELNSTFSKVLSASSTKIYVIKKISYLGKRLNGTYFIKVNGSRYEHCKVTSAHFWSLLKKILRKDKYCLKPLIEKIKYWYNQLRKAFW